MLERASGTYFGSLAGSTESPGHGRSGTPICQPREAREAPKDKKEGREDVHDDVILGYIYRATEL